MSGFVDYTKLYGEGYDDVYDEDGNEVSGAQCSSELLFNHNNGSYHCPSCNQELSREEFFNFIGAELPGPLCVSCGSSYPGCGTCPYGYIDEDELF